MCVYICAYIYAYIYIYIYYAVWQYARPLCLIDWGGCIYLFGVAVFKASMLN